MSLFSERELSFDADRSSPSPSDIPGTGGSASAGAPPVARRRFRHIARDQLMFALVDVERMLDESHPARAIWDFVGGLDLSRFEEKVKVYEGCSGREDCLACEMRQHCTSNNKMEKHGRAVSIRLEDDRWTPSSPAWRPRKRRRFTRSERRSPSSPTPG